MKLTTFFIKTTKQIYANISTVTESTFKIKAMLDTFQNFAYASNYLQTRTFEQFEQEIIQNL